MIRAAYSFKFASFITLCYTFRCFCKFSCKKFIDLDISRRIENPTLAARRVMWSAAYFALGTVCLAFAVTVLVEHTYCIAGVSCTKAPCVRAPSI
jgi:hypothetical protein